MATGYYPTEAQLALTVNSAELADWGDVDGNGSPETGVQVHHLKAASEHIWSIIRDRYSDTAAMDPAAYTAGSGAYPVLEYQASLLAADYLRHHNGGPPVAADHPVLKWATSVRMGLADVVA